MSLLAPGTKLGCGARQPGLRRRRRVVACAPPFGEKRSDDDHQQSDEQKGDPASLPSLAKLPVHGESLAVLTGSPGRIRTADTVVNSHLLCQLSYRGMGTPNKRGRGPKSTRIAPAKH
jgi:hypothetical protein